MPDWQSTSRAIAIWGLAGSYYPAFGYGGVTTFDPLMILKSVSSCVRVVDDGTRVAVSAGGVAVPPFRVGVDVVGGGKTDGGQIVLDMISSYFTGAGAGATCTT